MRGLLVMAGVSKTSNGIELGAFERMCNARPKYMVILQWIVMYLWVERGTMG